MITVKMAFENLDDLNQWFDHVCTRCAMCNRDCGHGNPCEGCKANRIYEQKKAEIEKGGKK